jgi:hypothetical protein
VLFGCLSLAPTRASAEVFSVSAIVSSVPEPSVFTPGPGTVHGSLNINTVTGTVTTGNLLVSNEGSFSGTFSLVQNCAITGACSFVSPSFGGGTYLYLDFAAPPTTTLVGYTGGPLAADSEFAASAAGSHTTTYYFLSGTVTAPEPSFYVVLAIGMSGLLFAVWRRRRA